MRVWTGSEAAGAGPTPRAPLNRRYQWVAAAGATAVALALALPPAHWPFDASLPSHDPTLWQFLLADRLTLGFVRLSVVLVALFVIASVPALFAAGRWLRVVGPSGVTADEVDPGEMAAEMARFRAFMENMAAESEALWETAMRAIALAADQTDQADSEENRS